MTAVPDIRRQCELLATHLAQVVASHRFAAITPADAPEPFHAPPGRATSTAADDAWWIV
jgi:hypothetical protein